MKMNLIAFPAADTARILINNLDLDQGPLQSYIQNFQPVVNRNLLPWPRVPLKAQSLLSVTG